uniref:Cathepsin O n=2 Tax=Dendroctonus ponderosae TaxID=77166 RepID=A0AAR5NWS1_DENPD
MPSPLRNFTYKTYIELGFYIALLFFVVPCKIKLDSEIREQFHEYLSDFNKSYPQEAEFQFRFAAFKKSLANIEQLNANKTKSSAQYGLTKFSDFTAEEFLDLQNNRARVRRDMRSAAQSRLKKVALRSAYEKELPQIVDWRNKNVVSKGKNQKNCGACWAFAVSETIESMQAIKTQQLTDLSIQQLIDCSSYNNGCKGGDTCALLRWIKVNNIAIMNETDYPLVLEDQKCQKTDMSEGVKVGTYQCNSFVGREDIILKLLAINGPVAVAISGETWQNYFGGVIQFHCEGDLSHAVQIVGYNLTAKVPFYIVRNSWGEDFGDNGYLYVAIGGNVCGLAYEVAAVTVL